jgi:hypothetical protein
VVVDLLEQAFDGGFDHGLSLSEVC